MRARDGLLLPLRRPRSLEPLRGLVRTMEEAGRRLDLLDPPRVLDVPRRLPRLLPAEPAGR